MINLNNTLSTSFMASELKKRIEDIQSQAAFVSTLFSNDHVEIGREINPYIISIIDNLNALRVSSRKLDRILVLEEIAKLQEQSDDLEKQVSDLKEQCDLKNLEN